MILFVNVIRSLAPQLLHSKEALIVVSKGATRSLKILKFDGTECCLQWKTFQAFPKPKFSESFLLS